MSWYDDMKADMLRMVQRSVPEAKEIQSFECDTEQGGYCETCAYEQQIVNIDYTTGKGRYKTFTYTGSLDNLLRELIQED